MASKTIQTILSLKDKFTKPVQNAAKSTKQLKREMQLGSNTVKKFAKNMNSSLLSIAKTTAKTAITATGAITSLAAGVGFKEAVDLEGYRLQLETATKDTEKASKIMQYAINLANKTPFEGGELVEGAAMFEAMGMSAQKWLPLAGDMAAATNKDFMQATEAIVDAQAGELERLKEFGVKKADIIKKAGEMFTNVQVVNNQGQIVDQEKFNEAMIALMQDKFTGGMEKQATTMKGLWSTVTGVTKSALASIIGITEDGSVRQGSTYEKLKNKIKEVANTLTQWQNDGTMQQIANTVTNTVDKAIEYLTNTIKWLKDNIDWVIPTAKGLLVVFAGYNILNSVIGIFTTFSTVIRGMRAAFKLLHVEKVKDIASTLYLKALYAGDFIKAIGTSTLTLAKNTIAWTVNSAQLVAQKVGLLALKGVQLVSQGVTAGLTAAQWALNAAFIASPIGWIVLGIAALIAVGVLLYKNWDTVKAKASELGEGIKTAFEPIRGFFIGIFEGVQSGFKNFINYISSGINTLTSSINKISIDIPNWVPGGVGGKSFGFNIPSIPMLAKGTSNWQGGPAITQEKGGEIMDLPSGTRVYPHDKSIQMAKQQGSKSGISLSIIINKIADKVEVKNESDMYKLADIVAEILARKVKIILANM